ncbi:MAG: right-handed parallel beta-helix repeat-containing protein [Acidobacteria bacterium]|nr:right-handed parallel beta-helix repeat-containing protein [Acidobacteriota bacterium]
MKKAMKLGISLFALLMAMLACNSMAQAQATRTWVSGVGDDANPCSRTAPCKTFAGAISKTAASGEISVLDPGGFGAVTITKAITINGYGFISSIVAAGTNGIIVNAGVNDEVILKNISIQGIGTGLDGIRFLAGNQLTVENVQISGFAGDGIEAALAGSGKMYIKDTNITNCGGAGIKISSTAGFPTTTLDNVRLEGLGNGLEVGAGSNFVTAQRSTFVNSGNGMVATGPATINVENSTIAFNTTGVNASGGFSTVRIFSNGIYNNGTGINIGGGATVQSDGSNRVSGNGSSQAPNAVLTKQ